MPTYSKSVGPNLGEERSDLWGLKLMLSEYDLTIPLWGEGRLDCLDAAVKLGVVDSGIAHSFGGTVIREGHQKACFIFTDRVIRCTLHEQAIS